MIELNMDKVSLENVKKLEFFNILVNCGIDFQLRLENKTLWDELFNSLEYTQVLYSNQSINYQIEYQLGSGHECYDVSIILFYDKKPCGLWPISLSKISGSWGISSQGSPVLPPIFIASLSKGSIKTLIKKCLCAINNISEHYGVSEWETAESFCGDAFSGSSEWHHQLMQSGAIPILHHELFVDLSLDLSEIKSKIRKSYKSLVSSGQKLWKVEVLTGEGVDVWNEFRELHLAVSGRVTRSPRTWEIHYQNILQKRAFLISLRNSLGIMVGAGYFDFVKDEGSYSVGVYDRKLFDKPLGHVIQYRAIEEMKKLGIRWYKIGCRPYHFDGASQKELSIADFKQGFATHLFYKVILKCSC